MRRKAKKIFLKDDGVFPNSDLPVLYYRGVLSLPKLFRSRFVKKLFAANHWTNAWKDGIYTFDHYHSTTHEALGFCKGKTTLRLGGKHGVKIKVGKGDVLIIPAGVAHKNLGRKKKIVCVGAYPNGRNFDINTGEPGERPLTDKRIAGVPLPKTDPLQGAGKGLVKIWK